MNPVDPLDWKLSPAFYQEEFLKEAEEVVRAKPPSSISWRP
jgi:hypothetical protein